MAKVLCAAVSNPVAVVTASVYAGSGCFTHRTLLFVCSVSKPLQAQWQHSEGPQLLDIPPLGANAAPQQLMQRLQLFHDQSVLSIQASTVTVSSLSLAAQSNMDHPALLSGLESQLPTAAQPHLAGIPVPRVNAHEFVRACFAEMGGKR